MVYEKKVDDNITRKVIYSKKLRKGTFHLHNDKNGGHPALIVEKNDKKNWYKAIQFTHKKRSDRLQLKNNINPYDKKKTYVIEYPIYDSRRNYGAKELDKYRIHKNDKTIINFIKRKK